MFGAVVSLVFYYLREWYAKWRGRKALLVHQKKYEDIEVEIVRVNEEISRIVSQRDDMSIEENVFQGYYDQLRGGLDDENNDHEIRSEICFLAGIWSMWYFQEKRRESCPEQCRRVQELEACSKVEYDLIKQLNKIRYPEFMSRNNYYFWKQYLKKRNVK